ncbi:MAG: xanthine dehydrogenase family protein molybdopterin-binding subunit [Solirubrobacterales bacterium]
MYGPEETGTIEGSEAKRVKRHHGDLVLTGRGRYLDDIVLPGMKHAAILRSTEASARILDVDVRAAREMPGVRWVMTGADAVDHVGVVPNCAEPAGAGLMTAEFRCLAVDRVRHEGEAVAAVVADTLAEAEAACDAIEVTYEPLPFVVGAEEALEPDAPLVFEHWGTNLLGDIPFVVGDPDAVFAAAPRQVDGEISIQRYNTAPMETRGYVATWEPDNRLCFYASTQNPHPLRSHLAQMLDLPESQIRVVAPRLGGGFGHKFHGQPEEGLIAALSKLVEAPVKWIETRAESMLVGGRSYHHTFSIAYDDDGKMLALRDRILGNIGTLGTFGGWGMVYVAGMTMPGPYQIEHYEVHSMPVVTNTPPWAGAIGYGKESAALMLERAVDLIARDLGVDPVAVRMRNFIPPDLFPYAMGAKRLDSGNYPGALEMLVKEGGYDERRSEQCHARDEGRLVGVGIAFELTPEGGDFAGNLARGFDTSTVRVDPSGSVTVLTGVTSPGTGNETGIAQVVAGELGISPDQVSVIQGDTDITPYGFGNFSSRGMGVGGGSAALAAREIRARLVPAAAVFLEADPEDIVLDQGAAAALNGNSISFAELAHGFYTKAATVPELDQMSLEATATWLPSNVSHIPDEEGRTSGYPTFPFSAHLAVVEIAPDTGVADVRSYVAVDDCGVVINPTFVEGQVFGSIAFGIGGALWESLPYDSSGHLQAHTFKEYLTPRSTDLPTMQTHSQVTPSPFTVLGTKGAGESGVAGAVAVIANAVNDALAPLGVQLHDMPLTAPKILAAINGARQG